MDIHKGEIRALGSPRRTTRTSSRSRSSSPTTRGSRARRRAAVQPRDPGRVSDRLDLQADHLGGGARSGLIRLDSPYTDSGSFNLGRRCSRTPAAGPRTGRSRCARRCRSRATCSTTSSAEAGNGHALQKWSSRLGIGRTSGIDLPGERQGLLPDRQARQEEPSDRPSVVDRRQREPRDRPGRRAGESAPDGGGVRGDRQRRLRREAAPRPAHRGRRRAARSRSSARRRAKGSHPAGVPAGDPRRAARRG